MLSIQHLSLHAGDFQLDNFSLEVPTACCTALMGPSGTGKTSVMEAVCGLRPVRSGSIHLDQREITHLRPGERNIAFVPQDNALFPHLTVRQHLSFSPSLKRWPKAEVHQRSSELARQLGISELLNRSPENLSGGEAKRVALGRALAGRPDLLCLDEALTGLDRDNRSEILDLLEYTIRETGVTTLLITHDRNEASQLARNIVELPLKG